MPAPTCPRCGAPLGRDVGVGVCAACLLSDALPAAEGLDEPSSQPGLDTDVSVLRPFGGYELIEEIGRGGMGVIYKARQRGLNRIVALKMLLVGEFADAKSRERLLREARTVASLTHPGIVAIHEVGEHDGHPFFAMEYVPGGNLAQHCRNGLLPVEIAVNHLESLARSVHYAHQRGVIHRDLKPANVLITVEGQAKLTDFGLTKSVMDPTRTIESAGSPNFMAPEQADSTIAATGPRTDVFALGAILYHVLTGRPPTVGESLSETLRAVVACEPVPPRQLRPALPRDLETITMKCLEREPARRYRSALEVAEDLVRWRNHEPILARPASPLERLAKWVHRRPVIAGLAAACFAILLAGTGGIIWQWRRAEAHRAATELESYTLSLQLAQQEIVDGDIIHARELLLHQPSRLRHIEWGRLLAKSYTALTTVAPSAARVLRPHEVFLSEVAPGGEYLVTWGADIVQLWRTGDGREIARWGGTNTPTGPATFGPDGKTLFLAGPGSGFSVWDAPTAKRLFADEMAGLPVHHVVAAPDGVRMAVASTMNRLELWDIRGGTRLRTFDNQGRPVGILAFSPDGHRLLTRQAVTGMEPAQTLWDVDSGRVIATVPPHPERYFGCEFSRDGEFFAAITEQREIEVWKTGDTQPFFRHADPNKRYRGVHVTKDGRRLLAEATQNNTVEIWDLKAQAILPGDGIRGGCHLTPDEQTVLTGGFERNVRPYDMETGCALVPIPVGTVAAGFSLHISPDGRFLAAGSSDNLIAVCPLRPADEDFRFPLWPDALAIDPTGEHIGAGYLEGRLLVWDRSTGRPRALHGHHQRVSSVDFSPAGRHLFSGGADGTMKIWDLESGVAVATMTNFSASTVKISESRDGKVLAAGDSTGRVHLFDTTSFAPRGEVQMRPVPSYPFYEWTISPKGDRLLQTAPEGIYEWDVASGASRRIAPLPPQTGFANAFYYPDGRSILVGGDQPRMERWQLDPPRLLTRLELSGGFSAVAFTADGQRLLINRLDSVGSSFGRSAIEVRDARDLRLLVVLGAVPGASIYLRLSTDERLIARTLLTDHAFTCGVETWSVFPWHDEDFPGQPGQPLRERVEDFAHQRLQGLAGRPAPSHAMAPDEHWTPPRSEWLPRDPGTPDRCVDLAPWFNRWLDAAPEVLNDAAERENTLREFPRGPQSFAGIPFDVRGLVAFGGHNDYFKSYLPTETVGVHIGRKARKLHFLHYGSWVPKDHSIVGRYRLHYANGESRDLELRGELDLPEWWRAPGDTPPGPARIVWRGHNFVASRQSMEVAVAVRTWDNPLPEKEIVTLDLLGASSSGSMIALIGLTLE